MFYKVFSGRKPAADATALRRSRLSALYLLPALIGLWLGLAELPGQAQGKDSPGDECAAALADFQLALQNSGLTLSAGSKSRTNGGCAFEEVVIRGDQRNAPNFYADSVIISGSLLAWDRKGEMPSADLVVEAAGMRFASKLGDARTDYLLGAQARVGAMTLDLTAAWDKSKKEAKISRFDLTFGETSRIRFGARLKNVDLSTPGTAQMAVMSAALTELDLEVKSFGLFEQVMLPLLVSNIPDNGDVHSEADFAALVAEKKLELRTAINQLPDAAFPAPSRAALAALLSDLPGPRGKLVVKFRSASGFGAARFARFALTGLPQTMKELAPLFDGTRFDIDWRRGDRS